MTFDELITRIRSKSHQWRDTIRSASCDEYMPGALSDAIEAKVEAIAWLTQEQEYFESLLDKPLSVGERRACNALIYECLKYRFKIKEDLKIKAQDYRKAILCRTPVSAMALLH